MQCLLAIMLITFSPHHSSSSPYSVDPPMITIHPQDELNVTLGNYAMFTVVAAGSNTYIWKHNGSTRPSDDRFQPNNNLLTIQNVQPSDVGSYCCVVSNAVGSITSNSASLALSELYNWNSLVSCRKQQMGWLWPDC